MDNQRNTKDYQKGKAYLRTMKPKETPTPAPRPVKEKNLQICPILSKPQEDGKGWIFCQENKCAFYVGDYKGCAIHKISNN